MSKLEAEETPVRSAIWPQTIAGIVFVIMSPIIASMYIYGNLNSTYMGQFAGYYFIISLFLLLLIGFIPPVKRTVTKVFLFGIFFLLCAGAEMSGEGKYSKNIISNKHASEALDEFQRVMVAAQTGQDIPSESISKLPSDLKNLLEVVKHHYKLNNDAFVNFEISVSTPAFSTLLAPDTLARSEGAPPELIHAKASLLEAKRLSTEYFRTLPQIVEMMELNPIIKENFLIGFNRSKKKIEPVMQNYFVIEETILNLFIDIHELCARSDTSQNEESDQILFANASNLTLYNSYIDQLSELLLKESHVLTELSQLNRDINQEFLDLRNEAGI